MERTARSSKWNKKELEETAQPKAEKLLKYAEILSQLSFEGCLEVLDFANGKLAEEKGLPEDQKVKGPWGDPNYDALQHWWAESTMLTRYKTEVEREKLKALGYNPNNCVLLRRSPTECCFAYVEVTGPIITKRVRPHP